MTGTFQAVERLIAVFDDGFYPSARTASWSPWTTARGDGPTSSSSVSWPSWPGWASWPATRRPASSVWGPRPWRALEKLAFVSARSVWSIVVIPLDVLVIYAIVVDGRELKTDHC